MIQGWKQETPEVGPEEKIRQIKHILLNRKVNFYTDGQALKEIARIVNQDISIIPEQDSPNLTRYRITFDGGTPCNVPALGYGIGYGSYQINALPVIRCDFKVPMSANCAEILTLVEAIRAVLGMDCRENVFLDIWGDSEIAINWANGVTKHGRPCKLSKGSSEGFGQAVQTLRDILRGFGKVKATWHSRTNSVRTFGH